MNLKSRIAAAEKARGRGAVVLVVRRDGESEDAAKARHIRECRQDCQSMLVVITEQDCAL